MSFADPQKPKGTQFLGVVITKCLGMAHAINKTHKLGINPSGEIMSQEIDPSRIKDCDFDKLLSEKDLTEKGYI